ncbi:chaperonin 10-like protein [Aspergillus desertorum]
MPGFSYNTILNTRSCSSIELTLTDTCPCETLCSYPIMQQMNAVRLVKTSTRAATAELRPSQYQAPGRHPVLIKVPAASLNYRDLALLRGEYRAESKEGVVPLSDGAAEVVAVGKGVMRVKPGDRVSVTCNTTWIGGPSIAEYRRTSVGFSIDGMLAEYAVFYEDALVPIPDYLSYVEAASLPCAAVTAWVGPNKIEPLQPGHTVLIQGAGGVSLFALQFVKILGPRTGNHLVRRKAAKLKELGADVVVNYSTHPEWDQVRY